MTWFQRMYVGVVAADLAPPVVDGPERDHALLELGDPRLGEEPGMLPVLDGGVLGREPEGVEPERRQDGLSSMVRCRTSRSPNV